MRSCWHWLWSQVRIPSPSRKCRKQKVCIPKLIWLAHFMNAIHTLCWKYLSFFYLIFIEMNYMLLSKLLLPVVVVNLPDWPNWLNSHLSIWRPRYQVLELTEFMGEGDDTLNRDSVLSTPRTSYFDANLNRTLD